MSQPNPIMLYIKDIEIIKAYLSTTDRNEIPFTDKELQAIVDYYTYADEEFDKYTIQAWGKYEDILDLVEEYNADELPENFDEMDLADKFDIAWRIGHANYPIIIMEEDEDEFEHLLVRVGK